jgi:hypothetical protein
MKTFIASILIGSAALVVGQSGYTSQNSAQGLLDRIQKIEAAQKQTLSNQQSAIDALTKLQAETAQMRIMAKRG